MTVSADTLSTMPLGMSQGREVEVCGARVALLAEGTIRSPLSIAAEASVLDLTLAPGRTVGECWLSQCARGPARASVVVLHSPSSPPPRSMRSSDACELTIRPDSEPYRGPAGALRDGCSVFKGDSPICVIEGLGYCSVSFASVMREHVASGAGVTLVAGPAGRPAGVMVLQPETLAMIPKRGFMDGKEQWLARVAAAGYPVRIQRSSAPTVRIRDRRSFLRAASAVAGQPAGDARVIGARLNFVSRDPEARISEDAIVVDSVVMAGAEVGPGSIVARSLLLPGARLKGGERVVDQVVGMHGCMSDSRLETMAKRQAR